MNISVAGMWTWQSSNQGSESGQGSSGSGAHPGGPTQGAPAQQPAQQQPTQGQELSDMLQMLDQGGSTTFEDLNMFNTTFE